MNKVPHIVFNSPKVTAHTTTLALIQDFFSISSVVLLSVLILCQLSVPENIIKDSGEMTWKAPCQHRFISLKLKFRQRPTDTIPLSAYVDKINYFFKPTSKRTLDNQIILIEFN